MPQGVIKKLVSDKGFGFIAGDNGELFFHHSVVEGGAFETLQEGQTLSPPSMQGCLQISWHSCSRPTPQLIKQPLNRPQGFSVTHPINSTAYEVTIVLHEHVVHGAEDRSQADSTNRPADRPDFSDEPVRASCGRWRQG